MLFSLHDTLMVTQEACVFYTEQVLGKSVKPIPVMVLGVLLAHKKYPWLKYLFVLMITTGVAMFMYKPSKAQAASETSAVLGWGEFLLVCAANRFTVNPLKCSGIRWLHLKLFSAIQVWPTCLISDIRALWRSGLSTRVPKCQKSKNVPRLDLDGKV